MKPRHLKAGDWVGLVAPASVIDAEDIKLAHRSLTNLGLKGKPAPHLLKRYGYLAGSDQERAADLNAMFADRSIQAILAMRGGWGCARILPLLDYNLIRHNPKILIGYSDITALLLAIYVQTGLVTFHGPVGISNWTPFSQQYFRQVLFESKAVLMRNTSSTQVQTIVPGRARGRLIGGNLSVLAALIGTSYLPTWNNTILFVEEVGEEIYRVDRLLTQLKLAGILKQLSGFIFAQCQDCTTDQKEEPSLSLVEVLQDHLSPLGIPTWYGSMIGHVQDKFTLPLGIEVEIDATMGTIRMLEPAVI